ncbi:AzlC family ABC transporter permease [Azospirillum oryzae]|uniref:AzlC family ABC transporter permease n=1 Tax=Azospirillum oryzae TaxID=286727 RepID=A0A6N1AK99_9PROT|nr:AzlC family ABC transporter permease [Azospirillum oryzae]QKS51769.1 AzlC family ABC transporter permease [Azospirillum oryzae]GLR81395.1 branched-chain amino acid ABC transporter permease [Azospirillum oryzae]
MSMDSITIPASPRQEFAAGVVHCLPIVAGAVPFGFLLGSLAAKAGLSALDMGLMSALVFAGSSQFVAVELLDKNGSGGTAGLAVVGAILLVNLRHLLMGATLEPRFRGVPRGRAGLALFFMTDEQWALALRRGPELTLAYWYGVAVTLYLAWLTSTVAGTLAGALIADPAAWGLDFTFIAVFLCLLAGFWRGAGSLPPWLASAAAALAVHALSSGGTWHILAGALAGGAVAAIQAKGQGRARDA